MKLIVNTDGTQPIYEQLKLQIKAQITGGELPLGYLLPSIRVLAKELKIGIITAKRVYDDLTAEGYTRSVAGKGVFVEYNDAAAISAAAQKELKAKLGACVGLAKANGIDKRLMNTILEEVWEDK